MLLKIVENGDQFRDVVIREGEMFLLPGMFASNLSGIHNRSVLVFWIKTIFNKAQATFRTLPVAKGTQ